MFRKYFFSFFIPFWLHGNAQNLSVAVYKDEGVSDFSYALVEHSFKTLVPESTVTPIKALDIIENALRKKKFDLLVMPGGADLFYAKKLKGKGNAKIREFVAKGGAYLGLCAGGYYGAKDVEFDKDGPLEVIAPRELAFFQGWAVGPRYPYTCGQHTGARAEPIYFEDEKKDKKNQSSLTVYYNGGGTFYAQNNFSDYTIIAQYQNQDPAIIYIAVGKGHVVLSGVHFEYCPDWMEKINKEPDSHLKGILEAIRSSNKERKKFFQRMIHLLVPSFANQEPTLGRLNAE
jgi:biotin--protein ligase